MSEVLEEAQQKNPNEALKGHSNILFALRKATEMKWDGKAIDKDKFKIQLMYRLKHIHE
jgi:hypothetical protein